MAYTVTDESTQHGLITPHGFGVPHKFPKKGENLPAIFSEFARQLYPTGRAFNIKYNSVFYNFHKAINVSFIRVLESAKETIDSTIPDNEFFSEDDAELWEYRLGLITDISLPLELRKDIISRKMAYPKNVKARLSPLFIESQLQAAGFNVWIHENRFFESGEWVFKSPSDLIVLNAGESQHGGGSQHGVSFQHGETGFSVIANLSVPSEQYSIGEGNLWATFFIGGEVLGEFASVPENRLKEFKELVLKLKPAHTVAFTFINYV